MTKRRGMYKEYIQILPATDAGRPLPLVAFTDDADDGQRALLLPAPRANEPPHIDDAPELSPFGSALPLARDPVAAPAEPALAADPPAAAASARGPSDGRIALIAATLALALSTGALTWSLTRNAAAPPPPRQGREVAAVLATEIADLKGRLAAADERRRAAEARIDQMAERIERSDRAQADAVARLAAQVTGAEVTGVVAGLDARIQAAAQAAVAAAMPAMTDITASTTPRPGAEPVRQVRTAGRRRPRRCQCRQRRRPPPPPSPPPRRPASRSRPAGWCATWRTASRWWKAAGAPSRSRSAPRCPASAGSKPSNPAAAARWWSPPAA